MEQEQPLTAVRLVCRVYPRLVELPHATHLADAFLLGEGTQWSLESASERGFVRLLDRLRKLEWPGLNQCSRDKRLNLAVRAAVKNGYGLRVLHWWLHCYMPGQTLCSMVFVFELAIQNSDLPVLDWLHRETQGRLPELTEPVECYDPHVIYWLHDHGGRDLSVRLQLHSSKKAGWEFIKWCIEHGDAYKVYLHSPTAAFDCAAEGDVEMVQQLLEYLPELCTPDSMALLVRKRNFDAAKWLYDNRPKLYFSDIVEISPSGGIKRQLGLEDVRWIAWIAFEVEWRNPAKRLALLDRVMLYAVLAGDLDLLKAVNDIREEVAPSKPTCPENGKEGDLNHSPSVVNLMDQAACRGNLAMVQWLFDHHHGLCSTIRAMNGAAAKGALDVIKWLHHYQAQGCTTHAMDSAATNGHLEVVQWLHQKRQEGCTSRAMDLAASGGFLEVVQWLHVNRSEGCTTDAMDLAARNGKLQVVQWLHEHRTEGSTTAAMDGASSNGHVEVLRFLHAHRSEGCTENAMTEAALNGHLEAFQWLHENRSEGCSQEALATRDCEILEFMARSTTYFSIEQIIGSLEKHGHFGTIDSIVREVHAKCGIVSKEEAQRSKLKRSQEPSFPVVKRHC